MAYGYSGVTFVRVLRLQNSAGTGKGESVRPAANNLKELLM